MANLTAERRQELMKELLEASDGTRADDFATLQQEFVELQADLDKANSTADTLKASNEALKRENFKLFERVGQKKDAPDNEDVPPVLPPEPPKDYLKGIVDDHGFF